MIRQMPSNQPPFTPESKSPETLSPTEQRLAESSDLDARSTVDILRLLNEHDARAVSAVRDALPRVADLVDIAAERLRNGGVIHYFGAGTFGRLGVLDAAEL